MFERNRTMQENNSHPSKINQVFDLNNVGKPPNPHPCCAAVNELVNPFTNEFVYMHTTIQIAISLIPFQPTVRPAHLTHSELSE